MFVATTSALVARANVAVDRRVRLRASDSPRLAARPRASPRVAAASRASAIAVPTASTAAAAAARASGRGVPTPRGRAGLLRASDPSYADAESAPLASSATASTDGDVKGVWYGRGLLLFVAAAYGTLSVAFKYVYGLPGPPSAGTIGAVRGVFAALCFVPMLLNESKRKAAAAGAGASTQGGEKKWMGGKSFWLAAVELAFWNLAAQGACNIALLFTEATRVSFLTQASIAFTPVLVSMDGEKVARVTWAGCALAIVGVVLLGFDGGGAVAEAATSAAVGLNVGDVIALFGAASYSMYIFRISTFGRKGMPGNLTQARSIHWSPYDRVGVVNADP